MLPNYLPICIILLYNVICLLLEKGEKKKNNFFVFLLKKKKKKDKVAQLNLLYLKEAPVSHFHINPISNCQRAPPCGLLETCAQIDCALKIFRFVFFA